MHWCTLICKTLVINSFALGSLLSAEVSGAAASAVGGTERVSGIAVAADLHLLVVLLGEGDEGWFHFTTAQSEDEVDGGLLLDVVVGEGAVVLQLLASEDKTLLIRRNGFLVLDLALQVLDGVSRLNVESDVLASKCTYEDLHSDKRGSGLLVNKSSIPR